MRDENVRLHGQIGEYWTAYGGISSILKSEFFWLSVILAAATFKLWKTPKWWDLVLAAIPALMGISLAAFTLFLSAGSEKFRELVAGQDSGKSQPPSLFVGTAAIFVHFLFVQFIALILALLSAAFYEVECPIWFSQFEPVARFILWGFSYFFFIYSICTILAASFAIFEIVQWFDKFISYSREKQK